MVGQPPYPWLSMTTKEASFKRDLAATITASYGIQVEALIERRTVTGIVAEDGKRYVWKPVPRADEALRLSALTSVLQLLVSQGVHLASPVRSRDGCILTSLGYGRYGYMLPWVAGRHLNIRSADERMAGVAEIAKLHAVLMPLAHPDVNALRKSAWFPKLVMRQKMLQQIWPELIHHAPWLSSLGSHLFDQMNQVLESYQQAFLHAKINHREANEVAFCHRDLAPHNLIYNERTVTLIDFDHAGVDDPLYDICQFLSHTLFLSDDFADQLEKSVNLYRTTLQMPASRVTLLFQMLKWPDILLRNLVDWYRQGCPKHRLVRIRHAAQKERERLQLLTEVSTSYG